MKVLHVAEPNGYGVSNYVDTLARAQRAQGDEVCVFANERDEALLDLREQGIEVSLHPLDRHRPDRLAAATRTLGRAIANWQPDIVHAHSTFSGLLLLPHVRRCVTAYSPHAWAGTRTGRWKRTRRRLDQQFIERFDALLCVSGDEASYATTIQPGHRDKIHVIGSSSTVSITGQRPHAAPTGQFLVCVGRISRAKGQDLLAAAWSRLAPPDISLVLVGSVEDADIAERAAAAGAVLVGHRHDIGDWFAAAAAAVQPSRWEGLSLATVEALAVGCPVFATRVSGMKEALTDGPHPAGGMIFDDVDELLREALRRVADHDLDELRAAGPIRYAHLFSADSLVERVQMSYGNALGAGSRRPPTAAATRDSA